MVIEMATTMKAKNSKCDGYMDRWGMIFFFKERERERERERETDMRERERERDRYFLSFCFE
jgi:hypothetical protein